MMYYFCHKKLIMKSKHLLVLTLLLSSIVVWSQNEKTSTFSKGKPIAKIYANFHAGINEGANPAAFQVSRVYLGYKYDLGDHFCTKIQLDIGGPNDVGMHLLKKRFAYFKNAYLQYKKGKIKVQFGIIPTAQFKLQEDVWGHRYIQKSVLDAQRMGSSADLGAYVYYKATDFISFDLGILNGEGYGKLQNDSSIKVALGTTITPLKGLQFRFYGDIIQKGVPQINWVNFVSYNWNNKFIVGFEYDLQYNYQNNEGEDLIVWSTYLSYNFMDKWQIFGRYDHSESSIIDDNGDPWRFPLDGEAMVSGIQYRINKHIKLAIDYQAWFFTDNQKSSKQFIFFNTEVKL